MWPVSLVLYKDGHRPGSQCDWNPALITCPFLARNHQGHFLLSLMEWCLSCQRARPFSLSQSEHLLGTWNRERPTKWNTRKESGRHVPEWSNTWNPHSQIMNISQEGLKELVFSTSSDHTGGWNFWHKQPPKNVSKKREGLGHKGSMYLNKVSRPGPGQVGVVSQTDFKISEPFL